MVSLNLKSRINYDTDITERLNSASIAQFQVAMLKLVMIVLLCGIQVHFITQVFKTGESGGITSMKIPGLSSVVGGGKKKRKKKKKVLDVWLLL